jgi:hypothetical protein
MTKMMGHAMQQFVRQVFGEFGLTVTKESMEDASLGEHVQPSFSPEVCSTVLTFL